MGTGWRSAVSLAVLGWAAAAARGAEVTVLQKPHDPYGAPRPASGQEHFPLRGTVYVELGLSEKGPADVVLPESVGVELEPAGGPPVAVVRDGRFADGCTGKLLPGKDGQAATLAVYADPGRPLRPATKYTIRVTARSRAGATLPAKAGTWQFTTEAEPAVHPVRFDLALDGPAVRWEGGFFTGVCNVAFCTSRANRIPTFELMEQVRKESPRAWSLQRDFWLTGMEHRPGLLKTNLPNIVRERETRRVVAADAVPEGTQLRVEDFFGHEQYRIPSGRPVTADYHAGDEVLVADGVNSGRAKVVRADDGDKTVVVSGLTPPKGGWKLAYAGPLPAKEDPDAPGLFPPGGCYLRKFNPCGTPAYYWGRLDAEWDLDHGRFHRRVLPNFADAPRDLSIDGRDWTTAKDYAELHEVVRAITGHIIDRYGAAALTFPWSVFNEPDLGPAFWRSDWDELQKFYDYTTDGILRAFEDGGYDSHKVFIGGLELGAIFGVHYLRVDEFLSHCSPREPKAKGALPLNAAFADKRLDGKRSKRVEDLCRGHGGRGAPCDFVSVHAYNASKTMADKLIRAKEMALEIDPGYYARLWVSSHESTTGWMPPPDTAYADSFLGNGYYPTWCADAARRLLARAAADPRYGFGESILTVWPAPPANFAGINDCVRTLHAADGRQVTVAMPILHFLGLLARMGPAFHVLPERTVGGHVVSGFASRDGDTTRVLLYSHNSLDTESRSDAAFDVTLRLTGLAGSKLDVQECRFDKDHNSYFRLGRELRDRPGDAAPAPTEALAAALRDMTSDRPATQLAGLEALAALGPAANSAVIAVYQLHERTDDNAVKEKAAATLKRLSAPRTYPAADVRKVEELSHLRPTGASTVPVAADGTATVTARVTANGANVLVVRPAAP